jgi:hypothetical protein
MVRYIRSLAKVQKVPLFPLLGGVGVGGDLGVSNLTYARGLLTLTHPCILEDVVDRRTLGQKRPPCSMGHHNNLHDRTRTVAGVKILGSPSLKYLVRIGQG